MAILQPVILSAVWRGFFASDEVEEPAFRDSDSGLGILQSYTSSLTAERRLVQKENILYGLENVPKSLLPLFS